MFTGIIEAVGQVKALNHQGGNITFEIESHLAPELKIDQSIAHNGTCLTVTSVFDNTYTVTAIDETLQKTNLGHLQVGTEVNLERCMVMGGRLDGHIVQGHVDQTGTCTAITEAEGSWLIDFEYGNDNSQQNVTVEKGSICINGVSLTCFQSTHNSFRVAIIPYTWQHTNFNKMKLGDVVNLEFDVIGKYVKRLMDLRN